MQQEIRRPEGYVTKNEAAAKLGISVKTLDRRMQTEELLARVLRIGRKVWLRATDVDAYFKVAQERGYI